MTFEDPLRKHGMDESSIVLLRIHGILDTRFLLALEKDDLKELVLNLGLLWKLVEKLKASEGEETSQSGSQKTKNSEWEHGKSDVGTLGQSKTKKRIRDIQII